jgi:hypothetical protein
LQLDRAAHFEARTAHRAAPRMLLDRARLARMVAHIDKPAISKALPRQHEGQDLTADEGYEGSS